MRSGRVKIVLLLASIVGGMAIAVIAYTAYWFVAAAEIEDRIADWAADQRARGITVEADAPVVRGYPLHFEVSLQHPSIDNLGAGWAWRGETVTASFRPWRFDKFNLKINGKNNLRFFDGAAWQDFESQIEDGRAWLELDDAREIEMLMLDFKHIDLAGPWGEGSAFIARMRARAERRTSAEAQPNPASGSDADSNAAPFEFATAALDVEDIRLPPGYGEEMGEQVEYLNFDFSMFGVFPDGNTDTALHMWRDDGGMLELNSFRLRWGPLGIESNGIIALDAEMRPIGALTADITGYGDIIDALIISNMIPLGDAFLAKVAFNMMAVKPDDGGPPVLRSVPVMAQDGGIFVGPVAVGTLPAIRFQ